MATVAEAFDIEALPIGIGFLLFALVLTSTILRFVRIFRAAGLARHLLSQQSPSLSEIKACIKVLTDSPIFEHHELVRQLLAKHTSNRS
jgi:hypothetical protein